MAVPKQKKSYSKRRIRKYNNKKYEYKLNKFLKNDNLYSKLIEKWKIN